MFVRLRLMFVAHTKALEKPDAKSYTIKTVTALRVLDICPFSGFMSPENHHRVAYICPPYLP